MTNKTLTGRESITINVMKAISILSVIAAHVVSVSHTDLFSKTISSFWVLFGNVGVIAFFVMGGFLYNRKPCDNTMFWKKKFFRIIIPWLVCSLITYLLSAASARSFSSFSYFKWVMGSGTWYYYITIYTFYLLVFKWFCDNDIILWLLIVVQFVSLVLISFGISTTIPSRFFTDYLNPLHWIGYFSFGVLVRKHELHIKMGQRKIIVIASYVLAIMCFCFLYINEIYVYFHIVSSLFCFATFIVIADISYKIAVLKMAKLIDKIGVYSYCIYLLHMQIVQRFLSKLPNSYFKIAFSPFIGLAIMLILINIGLLICKKIPYGDKIKMIVGL